MTTPAGLISLSAHIQTEFGGVNPASLSEYYGKGHAPASGAISMSQFQNVSAGPTLPTGAALIQLIRDYQPGGGDARLMLRVLSNGTFVITGNQSVYSTNWHFPTTASVGLNYYCKLIKNSGHAMSGGNPLNTIIRISNEPQWTYETSDEYQTANFIGNFTLMISNQSNMGYSAQVATFNMEAICL